MAITGTFEKQPNEQYPIAIEYSGKLPTGTNISSGVWSAIDTSTGADASATVLVDTEATISGTQSRCVVKSGVSGKTYKLTCLITLNDGSKLEDDINMAVLDS